MQQVQLFIGNERVELFRDETISLTQSIQNVKDIAKVFTDFTKTFTVPASKTNNKIFKHYYNFDIVDGFDSRTKSNGSIKLNGVDFRKGNIKLEGVDLKDNKPNAYRVTFFGDLTELKDLIGEDKLDSLSFLDNFTLEYSATEVKARLGSASDVTVGSETFSDVILAPLISCSERLYYDSHTHNEDDGNLHYESGTGHRHGVGFDDLKYAIKVYAIIRAIEEKYDIEFTKNGSGDFITNVDSTTNLWGSLYLWLHRKSGKYASSVIEGETTYSRFVDNFEAKQLFSYNNNSCTSTNNKITVVLKDVLQARLYLTASVPSGQQSLPYQVKSYLNGALYSTLSYTGNISEELLGQMTWGGFGSFAYGWTFEVVSSSALQFTQFEIKCDLRNWFTGQDITEGTTDITSSFNLQGFQFYPTQQIPEMKVLDFITGLFKTFNLTAYVQDDGKIKLQTLDSFYANQSTGSPYDITEFVDVDSSKVNVALPFSKVKFVFKESKSLLADKFNQLNNAQYGQLEYNADSGVNFVGKEYKVEAPWEKMLYERLTDQSTHQSAVPDDDVRIQYGLMKTENNENYLGKPLLFFADVHSTGSTAPISFVENSSTHNPVYQYFAPSHTIELGDTSYETLLFNAELDPYTKEVMEETLFKNYYKNYIQDVFSKKRRLTKVKAFLPIKILLKYNLADTFIVAGKKYKINSITTNLQTGESDIELLNEI